MNALCWQFTAIAENQRLAKIVLVAGNEQARGVRM